MTTQIVVLGAGYAGAAVIDKLEDALASLDTNLIWVSRTDYHLVLHEVHRVIRDPSVRETITIPIEEIQSSATTFIEGEVVDVDDEAREVEFADGRAIDYDYVLDCLGTQTDFHGVSGLEVHAFTLKNLDDALAVNEGITEAAQEATIEEPAQVIIGGAGLSGIQAAGEIATFREMYNAPIDIHLVEHSDAIFSGHDAALQEALRTRLEQHDIDIMTEELVTEADDEVLRFEADDPLEYNVLLWTGGITGLHDFKDSGLEENGERVGVDATLQAADERVFALGDSALVHQNDHVAPPTAQAAWQAAEVAGANVARAIQGQTLNQWTYENTGTLVSVGDEAVAHDVTGIPVNTFGGPAARFLKKAVTVKWVASVASWRRAARVWSDA